MHQAGKIIYKCHLYISFTITRWMCLLVFCVTCCVLVYYMPSNNKFLFSLHTITQCHDHGDNLGSSCRCRCHDVGLKSNDILFLWNCWIWIIIISFNFLGMLIYFVEEWWHVLGKRGHLPPMMRIIIRIISKKLEGKS